MPVPGLPHLALVVEQFIGPRFINTENEQIEQRLKTSCPNDDIHCVL